MDQDWRDGRDGRGSYKRPFVVVAQSDHRPIQDYSEEELREILEARLLDSDRRRER
jgi:phosphoglycerol transferase MdoB-like AlkP superfamily enzyme